MPYHSLIVERDVATPMRDGTVLRADIYRPQTDAPLPVLLQRTPYGHRIRLEISSSNFSRYDRNPNTGAADGAPRAALQTVFHDAAHPSYVLLPVVVVG